MPDRHRRGHRCRRGLYFPNERLGRRGRPEDPTCAGQGHPWPRNPMERIRSNKPFRGLRRARGFSASIHGSRNTSTNTNMPFGPDASLRTPPGRGTGPSHRIYPELTHTPKLLVPDIKASARIVRENGTLYPHHNLYYITSSQWDLEALWTVLTSGIAELFVSTYSVRMRGGYLRYQAQYLRKIRLPNWGDVPHDVIEELSNGSKNAKEAVYELFGITHAEQSAMGNQRTALK